MAAYKIGNFTFDTEEEYARGLEDAKKIEKIQSTVDLNEPETALRLYWLIRTGKIKFGSKVGKKFFLDIADAVAKSAAKNITQAQAPEQQAGEEPQIGRAGGAGPQQKDSRCGVCDGRISMFWLVFLVRLHESPRQSGE